MTPELALVTVVALLWGPTAIWILIRLVRGRSDAYRHQDRDEAVSASTSASNAVQLLVDEHGFWVCGACRSFNRPEARRCYGCATDRDVAIRPLPAGSPGTFLVPVMAEDVSAPVAAGSEPGGPWAEERDQGVPMVSIPAAQAAAYGVPVMADGAAVGAPVLVTATATDKIAVPAASTTIGTGSAAAMSRGVDGGSARWGEAPTPTSAGQPADPPASGPPALPIAAAAVVRSGSPLVLGARSAERTRTSGAACPFLGLEADPSSWYEFPDPGNLCHAVRGGDGSALGFIRRLLTGRPGVDRLQVISAQQQRTTCLSAEHRSCGRYLAALSVAARPLAGAADPGAPAGEAASGAPIPAVDTPAPDARPSYLPAAQPVEVAPAATRSADRSALPAAAASSAGPGDGHAPGALEHAPAIGSSRRPRSGAASSARTTTSTKAASSTRSSDKRTPGPTKASAARTRPTAGGNKAEVGRETETAKPSQRTPDPVTKRAAASTQRPRSAKSTVPHPTSSGPSTEPRAEPATTRRQTGRKPVTDSRRSTPAKRASTPTATRAGSSSAPRPESVAKGADGEGPPATVAERAPSRRKSTTSGPSASPKSEAAPPDEDAGDPRQTHRSPNRRTAA